MYCIACGAQNSDQDKFCARCGKPLVAGAAGQIAATAVSAPVMPSTAYRQGNKLIVPKGAPLPGYCVKCAQPVTGEFFKKKFHWHNPWLYLIVLISPIIFIIVAAILMKHVELLVPMCDEHRQSRKKFLIATWGLALGFIPGGILAGSLFHDSDTGVAVGLLAGFLMFVGAIVAGIRAVIMQPKEITPASATFTRVCEPFLAMLPSR
jgi:zinc-ribbon domain